MKNLFFKELKLAFHPVVWVFMFVFPIMIIIPEYPIFVCFIYICSCYPILFLGANKGVQSHDLMFTCLLPIKKSHAVKARILSCLFIQCIAIIIMLILSPLSITIADSIQASAGGNPDDYFEVGLTARGIFSAIGISLVGYSIYDIIFFPSFYRNGRTVVMGTLLGLLAFMVFEMVTLILVPILIPAVKTALEGNLLIQFGVLLVGIIIYILMHILIYKISSKQLEKVDL